MTLFDLAFIFLGIGLTEAVVKPIAKRFCAALESAHTTRRRRAVALSIS